jgi:hypothetical protein
VSFRAVPDADLPFEESMNGSNKLSVESNASLADQVF